MSAIRLFNSVGTLSALCKLLVPLHLLLVLLSITFLHVSPTKADDYYDDGGPDFNQLQNPCGCNINDFDPIALNCCDSNGRCTVETECWCQSATPLSCFDDTICSWPEFDDFEIWYSDTCSGYPYRAPLNWSYFPACAQPCLSTLLQDELSCATVDSRECFCSGPGTRDEVVEQWDGTSGEESSDFNLNLRVPSAINSCIRQGCAKIAAQYSIEPFEAAMNWLSWNFYEGVCVRGTVPGRPQMLGYCYIPSGVTLVANVSESKSIWNGTVNKNAKCTAGGRIITNLIVANGMRAGSSFFEGHAGIRKFFSWRKLFGRTGKTYTAFRPWGALLSIVWAVILSLCLALATKHHGPYVDIGRIFMLWLTRPRLPWITSFWYLFSPTTWEEAAREGCMEEFFVGGISLTFPILVWKMGKTKWVNDDPTCAVMGSLYKDDIDSKDYSIFHIGTRFLVVAIVLFNAQYIVTKYYWHMGVERKMGRLVAFFSLVFGGLVFAASWIFWMGFLSTAGEAYCALNQSVALVLLIISEALRAFSRMGMSGTFSVG